MKFARQIWLGHFGERRKTGSSVLRLFVHEFLYAEENDFGSWSFLFVSIFAASFVLLLQKSGLHVDSGKIKSSCLQGMWKILNFSVIRRSISKPTIGSQPKPYSKDGL